MKREKLQQLGHLAAGILTLVYGFDTLEAGEFSSATYYLSLAIIFLIVAGSHKWIIRKFMQGDVAFYFLEAATIVYTGWNYKMKGHHALFYTMVAAGGLYFIFALLSLFTKEKPRHRSRRKKRRSSSSLEAEKKPVDRSIDLS